MASAVDKAGDEAVTIKGRNTQLSSVQYTIAAGGTQPVSLAAGASEIGVYVESGDVRVRTDGSTATATTGEPLGQGYGERYAVASLSIYSAGGAVVTVVHT